MKVKFSKLRVFVEVSVMVVGIAAVFMGFIYCFFDDGSPNSNASPSSLEKCIINPQLARGWQVHQEIVDQLVEENKRLREELSDLEQEINFLLPFEEGNKKNEISQPCD